jgi:hypothetical protein
MPGIYNKNNLLIRSLQRKYPYDDVQLTLRKPKFLYDFSTLNLPPKYYSDVIKPLQNDITTTSQTDQSDVLDTAKNINSDISLGLAIPGVIQNVVDGSNYLGMTQALGATNLANSITEGIAPVLSVSKTLGNVASAAGGVMSAVELGKDINKAMSSGEKMSFDDGIKMADDITGVASAVGKT